MLRNNSWLQMLTGWLQCLGSIQLWLVAEGVQKMEKVCRAIKEKVNKHLSVIRKQTLLFYKSDFLQSC